ncbi:MAG: hypothetical protein AAF570_28715, partial [Bacteroidota bacterium]
VTKSNYNRVARQDFARNFIDGFINVEQMKKGPEAVFKLSEILAKIKLSHPHLGVDAFMLVRQGSRFDRMPYIVL